MTNIASHSVVGGAQRTLVEVLSHAETDARICVFALPDGTRRYASEAEWQAGADLEPQAPPCQSRHLVTSQSTDSEKIALFRSLFRGREEMYAHGYLKREGTIGYVPVCVSDRTSRCPHWTRSNPGIACAACPARSFIPMSDDALKAHFKGRDSKWRDVCGLYVLTEDSKTWVLAADFDKAGWEREVRLYCDACDAHGLVPNVERSRSGNGAHVWLFFEEEVDASLARDLGSALISWAMERSAGMDFTAYDRFFPTQTTLATNGLGNLIALPFQGMAMRAGNSVFVDKNMKPYADQWQFLSTVTKVSEKQARYIVEHAHGGALGNLIATSEKRRGAKMLGHVSGRDSAELGESDFPPVVTVTKRGMIHVAKEGLSARAENRVRRLAAFANPDFYRAQAMHQSVYNKSRIIWCGQEDDTSIMLPRGCERELTQLVKTAGAKCAFVDKRTKGRPLVVEFRGELRGSQRDAADALLSHELGILAAPTGFGKTVVAASLIGKLKMRTLILVPRTELVRQWVERLEQFLAITDDRPPLLTKSGKPSKRVRPIIGRMGGGKNAPSGLVDVATFQSLTTKDNTGELMAKPLDFEYDMVICDECHHGAAPNLERVMCSVSARRVYGLSATPQRSDGLQNIVYLQCGPVRCTIDPKEQAAEQSFARLLVPRFTRVRLGTLEPGTNFNDIISALCEHEARNRLVVADVVDAVRAGRTPLVLTRRVAHVKVLSELLEANKVTTFMLCGTGGARARRERMDRLRKAQRGSYAVVATGSYVGEGVDLPQLDTLMLACPYSWEGAVTQYVGRLHREEDGKEDVIVYDYVDSSVPRLQRMYKSRLKAYARLAYTIPNAEEDDRVGDGACLVDGAQWQSAFAEDIASAEKSVRIAAPYASEKAVGMLQPVLRGAVERGVPVMVYVDKPIDDAAQDRLAVVCGALRELGCAVRVADLGVTGAAVIDEKITWYGCLPLLAMPKEGDCSIRIVNVEIALDAAELIEARG